MLRVAPISLKAAMAFVHDVHRHELSGRQRPVRFGLFAASVVDDDGVVRGVAIVGRPVARMLCDGWTCEVVRVATDGCRNACSMLYSACAKAAKALGYRSIVTYTRADEPGTSLKAAGWVRCGTTKGQRWTRRSRPRADVLDVCDKVRWAATWSALLRKMA